MEPRAPLSYALGSEHHLNMSRLGGYGGRLEKERDERVVHGGGVILG